MKVYYPVIFFQDEDGKFVGIVPDLQGCLTQGNDLTAAMYCLQKLKILTLQNIQMR